MQNNSITIVPTCKVWWLCLAPFFELVRNNKFFHPHPLDEEQAKKICDYGSCKEDENNLYYVISRCKGFLKGMHGHYEYEILAYGFVRGWDEGWKDKCLGIIVRPDYRGRGFGKLLVQFLHTAAKQRGLKKIRLHVNKNNPALNLYKKVGYSFDSKRGNGELIGICYL